MLKSSLDVRLWLSRGRPTPYREIGITQFSLNYTNNEGVEAGVSWERHAEALKYAGIDGFADLPLESSISAIKAVALPRHLLDLAVVIFLAGIGLYELFCWKSNAAEDGIGYRNIFIVVIVILGLYALYDLVLRVARITDDGKRNVEFGTKTLGGYNWAEKLQRLEQELAAARQHVTLPAETDQILAELNESRRRRAAMEERIWKEWEQELEHRLAAKGGVPSEKENSAHDQDEGAKTSPPTVAPAPATREPSAASSQHSPELSNLGQEASH